MKEFELWVLNIKDWRKWIEMLWSTCHCPLQTVPKRWFAVYLMFIFLQICWPNLIQFKKFFTHNLGCLSPVISYGAKDESNNEIFLHENYINPRSCLDCLPRLTCPLFKEDSSHQQEEKEGGRESSTTKFFLSQMVYNGLANQTEVDALPGSLEKSLNDSCRLNVARQLVSFWFDVPFLQVQGNFLNWYQ